MHAYDSCMPRAYILHVPRIWLKNTRSHASVLQRRETGEKQSIRESKNIYEDNEDNEYCRKAPRLSRSLIRATKSATDRRRRAVSQSSLRVRYTLENAENRSCDFVIYKLHSLIRYTFAFLFSKTRSTWISSRRLSPRFPRVLPGRSARTIVNGRSSYRPLSPAFARSSGCSFRRARRLRSNARIYVLFTSRFAQ